jgi:hypothetical protein
MYISVIYGRTHSRLVNGRQDNLGTRNGSRIFHANHAVIMNEVRCILQVFRQGVDGQRLTEDAIKLRAARWSKVRYISGKSAIVMRCKG